MRTTMTWLIWARRAWQRSRITEHPFCARDRRRRRSWQPVLFKRGNPETSLSRRHMMRLQGNHAARCDLVLFYLVYVLCRFGAGLVREVA